MAWFFVQVWVLCLAAFLLGAAVTWLAFVRPLRRSRASDVTDWPELPAWPGVRPPAEPPVAQVEPEPGPGSVTDPALSALDAPGRRDVAGPGAAATEALDRLGVVAPIPERSAGPAVRTPEIPAQSGPADPVGR